MDRKLNRSKRTTVRQILGHFFTTTTLHGFKYLWSDFLLDRTSACCAGVLCAVLWARFLEVPAVLQLRDVTKNPALPRYAPDVAVCAPTHTFVGAFLRHQNINASMSIQLSTTIERVLAGTSADEDQVKVLEQLLSSQNLTLTELMSKYSPECKDLMRTCRWQHVKEPCSVLFENEMTSFGPCCRMHPDKAYYRLLNETVRPTSKLAQVRTLDMSLQCSNETTYGCKFFVKYDGESNVQPTVLTPGYIYFAEVVFISVPRSSAQFLINDCISDRSYSEEICLSKCAEKYCGCSDPLHDFDEEDNYLPPCSIAHLGCLRAYEFKDNMTCGCLPSCNKMTSTISLESTPLGFGTFTLDPMYDGLNTKSTVLHMRLNIPISKIFFLSPTETWLTLLYLAVFTAMDFLISLFYVLFCICTIYPPAEFVSAGFTIAHLFEDFLGSENVNFVGYHMKRTSVTVMVHAALPFGFVLTNWCAGWRSEWVAFSFYLCLVIFLLAAYRMLRWWEYEKKGHPVVKTLQPYVTTEGTDWRMVAAHLNTEFKNVDKVCIPLTSTSKFVATQNYLIKVTQYAVQVVMQRDCTLVATGSDHYSLSASGEEEVQYVNIEVIPNREDIIPFSFRISTTALRDDLQPRLMNPVRVPENISLLPTLIERFVTVFKQYVNQNPTYYIDEEAEQCIGCMQASADVKLNRRCMSPPPHLVGGPEQCQRCECRVLWCAGCMARWWAARARGAPAQWLSGRCTCPVCRAPFCLLDVCPARVARPPAHA